MSEIWGMVKTPQFWICTVIAGFVWGTAQNVAAHWLITKFPNKAKSVMSKLSEKWATRTKELKAAREKRITDIMSSPQEQTFLVASATNKIANGFILAALSIVLVTIVLITVNGLGHYKEHSLWNLIALLINLLFFGILACFCLHLTITSFHEAEDMRSDVETARRRLNLRID